MQCRVQFKDGNFALVNNLKEISSRDWTVKVEDFKKFNLSSTVTYTFIGDDSLKVLGADILYILIF